LPVFPLSYETATFSVPGASSTVPTSINSSGSIAGYYVMPSTLGLDSERFGGFVRDPKGAITTFAGPGGGAIPGNWAYGGFEYAPGPVLINDAGVVAGSYYDAHGVMHGFVGNPKAAGGVVSFDPPGSTQTFSTSINWNGSATGVAGSFLDVKGVWHGFLYVGGTSYTIDYPGAQLTQAWSVTPEGVVLGLYNDKTGQHGFYCVYGCFSFSIPQYLGNLFANSSLAIAANQLVPPNHVSVELSSNIRDGCCQEILWNSGGLQGINSSGMVIGWDTNVGKSHVYLLSVGGYTVTTPDPPGSDGNAKGMAINDAGAFTGTLGSLGFVSTPR
jgi:hypothetical protein